MLLLSYVSGNEAGSAKRLKVCGNVSSVKFWGPTSPLEYYSDQLVNEGPTSPIKINLLDELIECEELVENGIEGRMYVDEKDGVVIEKDGLDVKDVVDEVNGVYVDNKVVEVIGAGIEVVEVVGVVRNLKKQERENLRN